MISFGKLKKSELALLKKAKNRAPEVSGDGSYCIYSGFLLERRLGERGYYFPRPVRLIDGSDVLVCIEAIAAYARKEEIPLVFSGVPREELSTFCDFSHLSLDAEDKDRTLYTVRAESEISLLTEIPSVALDGLTLDELLPSDAEEYFRLATDETVNKFWGYDYRADEACPDKDYFYNEYARALELGTALSLAVRYEGKLIGEASLYSPDLKGGAEISFRLFKEYWGRGLGRLTVEALLELAERLSLTRLYATVDKHNAPSLALLSDYMTVEREEGGLIHLFAEAE